MLAMYVCWDNPSPMLADYPTAYEGQPGFDFLWEVPTYWDETRVLAGEPGRLLVTARRKGRVWYVGGLAAGSARNVEVKLSFLKGGEHIAKIWRDGSASTPDRLTLEQRRVRPDETLRIPVMSDGGFVAQFASPPPKGSH